MQTFNMTVGNGQGPVQRCVPKRPPMKVGLDRIGKATPMTLACGVLGVLSCSGGSLDSESTIRVGWVRTGGGSLPISSLVSRVLVFSRVVLLLIGSGRACFGTSGFPFFSLTLLFMTTFDRAGPPDRLSNLHYLWSRAGAPHCFRYGA